MFDFSAEAGFVALFIASFVSATMLTAASGLAASAVGGSVGTLALEVEQF